MGARATPGEVSPHGRVALWLFLALSVFYVGITRGHFISSDEVGVYQQALSLWEQGTLSTLIRLPSSFPGRNDRYYGVYNVGQSVAALPLYGLGKVLGQVLHRAGREDWVRTLAGPAIGPQGIRWGGELQIFFVNLFNCFTTALLCAVFLAFSLRLGASLRWALVSTALLGLTSYVAPFSTGFFQHSNEALFLLWAFYLLFSDAQRPDWKSRAWAGVAAGLMLQFRAPSFVALPGLGLYLLASVWRRRSPGLTVKCYLSAALGQIVPFVALVAASTVLHVAVNYIKLGTLTVAGGYAQTPFSTPLLTGLYGFLLSPGESMFLFTPLLVLAPWTLAYLSRRYPAEVLLIVFLTVSYLVFYGKVEFWHGMWGFGPRYLVPLVPLLLLPLGCWMEHVGRKAWLAVAPLAAVGFWVQLVHVAVNFWYVVLHENYINFRPPYGFLFIWDFAPILAHSRALVAADRRVDMWLISVYRGFGPGRMLTLALPLLTLLAVCLWKLRRSLGTAEAAAVPASEIQFSGQFRPAIAFLACLCIGTGLGMALEHRPERTALIRLPIIEHPSDQAMMKGGLDTLYTRGDPTRAAEQFRKVLERSPNHYGATFQLAYALDAAGKRDEARPWWKKVLRMAEGQGDTSTATTARARLAQPDAAMSEAASQEAMMKAGVALLYANRDPNGAVAQFRKVLERNPTHYGATFQLAMALDHAGKPAEARPLWEKVLKMAEGSNDKPTADTARARLQRRP